MFFKIRRRKTVIRRRKKHIGRIIGKKFAYSLKSPYLCSKANI